MSKHLIEVDMCGSCLFFRSSEGPFHSISECAHPDGSEINMEDNDPPNECPLRDSAVIVTLRLIDDSGVNNG